MVVDSPLGGSWPLKTLPLLYSEAKRQFSDRNMDVLMNVRSPYKWWSILESAVFGSSSSFPPFVSAMGWWTKVRVGW